MFKACLPLLFVALAALAGAAPASAQTRSAHPAADPDARIEALQKDQSSVKAELDLLKETYESNMDLLTAVLGAIGLVFAALTTLAWREVRRFRAAAAGDSARMDASREAMDASHRSLDLAAQASSEALSKLGALEALAQRVGALEAAAQAPPSGKASLPTPGPASAAEGTRIVRASAKKSPASSAKKARPSSKAAPKAAKRAKKGAAPRRRAGN
jgi:hypothetical protein